jgi:hypothetical protein
MELDPDRSRLYVANGLTNDVTGIDIATFKSPVGRLPGVSSSSRKSERFAMSSRQRLEIVPSTCGWK